MKKLAVIIAATLLASFPAFAQSPTLAHRYDGAPHQSPLVKGLREISGLAIASETSVYAHNDEHGIVYELDVSDGAVRSAFAFGDPTVSADFEGIATLNGRVYLATSTGLIYEGFIGEHRGRVRFNVYDTGVGAFCEVEGLSRAREPKTFLILCKRSNIEDYQDRLVIFQWDLGERAPVSEPIVNKPYQEFLAQSDAEVFRPSALEWNDKNGTYVILSARSHQLVILDQEGGLLYQKSLQEQLHAQAEGVALTSAGDLIIADEGAGRGPGKLSVYKFRR